MENSSITSGIFLKLMFGKYWEGFFHATISQLVFLEYKRTWRKHIEDNKLMFSILL